ncbi:ABC transporter substrate-binding protein [Alloalcanivorax mobilis]|uniref:ABC transporter substrate-binding protein n=1 Tax=Alloalcanivorax mobilis TaxID=2019569 RepID=UPI000B5B3D7A|nr:ABC transporter substrate-binding protein [Alloalcanivorax mobilis]ASK36262.1 peptide ABC transporter [Alcanivorax sp. N3-2A]|tara:strand:- start:3777 stop:5360 length:1584 start_codon:yes stop_codon:yes gene_type:complete
MHDDNDDLIINGARVSRRAFIGLLGGAMAAGTLVSPVGALAQMAGGKGGLLRVSAPANPSSLDPATGGSGSDHVILFPLYDTLITWDYTSLKAEPGLAESWTFSDPKTLVLTLREGVKFHDGTVLDAQAVKTNLDRSRSAEFSNIRSDLESVAEVKVNDSRTVTLHLKNPDTALPLILSDRAGMMVSPAALKKNNNRVDRTPVGAGFMRFEKWNDGSEVAMTAFPDYWRKGHPMLAGITFKIITDSATRLRAVMSGQSDFAYHLDGRQKPLVERVPTLKSAVDSTVYCYQLYMNMSRKPLTDVRVRQAINHAIDRESFIRATMAGAGEAAYMFLPKSHWAYDAETAKLYPHDPDKAKALLKEAGYADGIELDLRGYNDQSSVQMQEVLLSQFGKANIRGRFRTGTIADMSAAYFGQEKTGDMLLSAWTGRPDPSLTYALLFSEDSYFNAGHAAPPEGFEEAVLASRSSDDLDERREALAKVQQLVMEHALSAPLAFRQSIVATSAKVQNYQNNLLGKPKFDEVSLKG